MKPQSITDATRYADSPLWKALAFCVANAGGLVLVPKDAPVPAIVIDPSDPNTIGVHVADEPRAAVRRSWLREKRKAAT